MKKVSKLIKLIEDIESEGLLSSTIQLYLAVRGAVLGLFNSPLRTEADLAHIDFYVFINDYPEVSRVLARTDDQEQDIMSDERYLVQLATLIAKGSSITEINLLNAEFKLPAIPDEEAYRNYENILKST